MATVLKDTHLGGSSSTNITVPDHHSYEIVDVYYRNSSGVYGFSSREYQQHVVDAIGDHPHFTKSISPDIRLEPGSHIPSGYVMTIDANDVSANGLYVVYNDHSEPTS